MKKNFYENPATFYKVVLALITRIRTLSAKHLKICTAYFNLKVEVESKHKRYSGYASDN